MKLKSTLCLLTILSISVLASTYLTLPVKAEVTYIEFLNHWAEPHEVNYWANVTKEYNDHYAPAGYQIKMTSIDFGILYDTIVTRHSAGQDPDIISMHSMWIPRFANWRSHILAVPPTSVQDDVIANWTQASVDGSTYKGIVWGYPSEFNSWGLVYDKTLLAAEGYTAPPTTWEELKTMAIALTKRDGTGKIIQSGFVPFIEGMPEEQRYQFLSLLWSNGGEYLDLSAPKPLFNSTKGVDIMQLYFDLGFGASPTYDHLVIPDYWWQAWVDETIAMMILPTWMTYVRDAMGDKFSNLAIAPIPKGPQGPPTSVSAMYSWILTVTQRAEDQGRAAAAWDFLKWISAERPQYWLPLPSGTTIGPVPKGNGCSIMGDYLIYDSIVPARANDQINGRLTDRTTGTAGPLLKDDFWFKGFIDLGLERGRADRSFLMGAPVQYEIGQMFEKVTLGGSPAADTVQQTADKVAAKLPMPGDIDINGLVDIYDAVYMIRDIDARPSWGPTWYRGRSDIDDSLVVDIFDITILSVNFGKTGGY